MIHNFSKFGSTVPLKNKTPQILKDFFEKIPITSRRKPFVDETDDSKVYVNKFFTNLLNKNYIKRHIRYTSTRAAFAEEFNKKFRINLERPVFLKRDCN